MSKERARRWAGFSQSRRRRLCDAAATCGEALAEVTPARVETDAGYNLIGDRFGDLCPDHVTISRFGSFQSDAAASLAIWIKEVSSADRTSPSDPKRMFRDADFVGDKVVFNIARNRYRLMPWIAYKARKVFIKAILSHKEYDKENWT